MQTESAEQFEDKEDFVRELFTEIAAFYDEMNDIMTMGMVQGWHRFMMKKAGDIRGKRCIDIGTGTGEIAFLLAEHAGPEGEVIAVDITPRMLELAEEKMKERNLPRSVRFMLDDALHLKQETESFDLVTSGYMLRNVTDVQQALNEMYRVLKKGGMAVVAELSQPDNRIIRFFYDLYIKYWVLRNGRRYDRGEKIGGRMPAYDWLTTSVEGFPHGREMVELFRKAGFESVTYYSKSIGAVNIYVAVK
ncbi:MAG: demethylmenaquinone methyltransferase / 2-methoxy-6-polyprenyl,4-benzoquinol methylase [Candidatus Methanomethylophilaceae archaeon]|nr:demethylmenaquinone methyltransferase / 2-methoxy-6-polyprenyl,4-benzoquinol methylase [Candidatus Methanomethylophilaceae archaeon]MDI3541532.1 demethylmenaquinone methyltransferase / 2-methoxy-6-polyprenyl,4-benzoquinol methylase [Candidatus Methanomethylophilaceae archaeon]